ncbi:DNA topoisomerase 3-beta-1-like isoform X2 [Uloborus diversus]|uniref:DNA topoisomerase 3-beta-1-like isoform X2 n=1 Tax=Uloborus diversus TaxID=327109 RepID=UPI00240A3A08|nr:DNA topoisomerase 3-beta-1-like isoform X2 [Uloborus diversus]
MKQVLMVAEKPSLAQSLAHILSNGHVKQRKGLSSACAVYEYDGIFNSQSVKFKMTSVCGHVMSTDFLPKYNNWDRVDPAELFNAATEKREANPKLQIPKFLQSEARTCDYLVLWLDCDKEGENICFEVINAVKGAMRPSFNQYEQVIYRARFSAITEKDIKAAMRQLGEPNENESLSVDARQELDLRIGCAFTRFQTKFFQNKYGNLDSTLISFGPCQTPTLGFCVERHDRIASFKPETYYVLAVKVLTPSEKVLSLDWDRIRIFDNEVANVFFQIVKQKTQAVVTNVSQKEKAKQRPLALNTVELMRVASAGLNMGPHHAMMIAEKLYTQGYISYPRTETTSYPENFDLKGTLQLQNRSPEWGHEVQELLSGGLIRPRKGHDAGDHPPITPMKLASRNELDAESWKIYDYIARHFIATLCPDLKYLHTVISFQIGEETFTCSGKALLDPGYTKVMTWQALGAEETLPDLKRGDVCKVSEVKLAERQTSPPDYLTEAELITLMEKHGIGTDASIPVHINNICQRNYVTVSSGRKLIPTNLGIVLVHGYQKIDPDLVLPTMRAAVEKQLNLIALGKENYESVLQHTLTVFRLKFQYFVTNICGMDELFEASFSPLSESGKPQSRCGKCRRYMKLIATKPCRLHCPTCDETLSVPQAGGNIRIFRELKCPLDDFELLQYTGGAKGKSFIFCPYCYNNPPFRDMRKLSGCNSCTHPTCPYSLNSNGVSNCSNCEGGVLVLDPGSGPKWKLSCNRCDTIVRLFEDAVKVSVDDDTCKDCGSQLVTAEYKKFFLFRIKQSLVAIVQKQLVAFSVMPALLTWLISYKP